MNRAASPVVCLAALLAGGMAAPVAAQVACADDRVTISGDWGQARFAVQIADDAAERAQGLMFVRQMPTMSGMLFIYEFPQRAGFWMHNTMIPLDMLFADTTGRIVTVHQDAIPKDRTAIPGGDDIRFVLEINGGLAARLGIAPGDHMQHPAIGPDPVAPCP